MKLFFVVGEESGDHLAADLIEAVRDRVEEPVEIAGSGGNRMKRQGLHPLFPLSDIAVMGFTAVVARLPTLMKRISQCVAAIGDYRPDAVVIVDSPDFTHRVAARVRARHPSIPIIGYVSPSVWVWRSGRAAKMARYVDHLLAILPFEPAVHRRLNGPPCTYVGHPILDRLDDLRPGPGERVAFADADRPVLLVLPGSRRSETSRLLLPFAATLERLVNNGIKPEILLPAVEHLEQDIRRAVASWPVRPTIVSGEEEKLRAFRRAHAALAASGTVTLELALAGVPTVVAYKVDIVYATLRRITGITPVISLPNIILDDAVLPELIEERANAADLEEALRALLSAGPARERQISAFKKLDALMRLENGARPAEMAAKVVVDIARHGRPALPAA
ncbi:MAG: lipid-A-disaccharide synthase [Pseudomonadota bacterium]